MKYTQGNMLDFEDIVTDFGLSHGMLAYNARGYISPITRKLFDAFIEGDLTYKLVQKTLKELK